MNRFFKAGFAGVVAITLTATAMASGPKWSELGDGGGDAGDLPFGAQVTMGPGSLTMINGNLGMAQPFPGDIIDTVDMFLINIVTPADFRVTTDPEDGELGDANAQFDTQLWLFRPTGTSEAALGVMGNDDHFELGGKFSLLLPETTDGVGDGVVDQPGLYYIAITRSNHDPFSDGNIFNQVEDTEISGPDGPGGDFPLESWAGDMGGAFDGEYHFALRGVEHAVLPAPGALGLFMIAAVSAWRRRRRPLLG